MDFQSSNRPIVASFKHPTPIHGCRGGRPHSSHVNHRQCTTTSMMWLVVAVLLACCGYFWVFWEPEDYNNIGNVRAKDFLSYGPIDVVYTWVNGSDPRWKEEKDFWHKHWIASLTDQPLPKRSAIHKVQGNDVSNSDNRFRDNEELRYSLRSLEKYAPWIRHVYIVTDGQIPSWLNLESPRVSIVKHAEIFANQSHLPVFSSPSIEANLVNIPGLSDSFLYFNDDVFLGSYVSPEDFISVDGVQKVYFAWEIPLCAPNCWDSWLQNGQCNAECNVTSCDFDMGDCGCQVFDNRSVICDSANLPDEPPPPTKVPLLADHICQSTCHYRWLGDNLCDYSCNVSSCGWDAGDCGVDLLKTLPQAQLKPSTPTLVHVPLDINATYLDLSHVFGVNGTIQNAVHSNERLIRSASLFEEQMTLVLVFGRTYDGDSMTSGAVVTVEGADLRGNSIAYEFYVVRGNETLANVTTNETLNGFWTYENVSFAPTSVHLPLGFENATVTRIVLPDAASSLTMEADTKVKVVVNKEQDEDEDDDEDEDPSEEHEESVEQSAGDSHVEVEAGSSDTDEDTEEEDHDSSVNLYRLAQVELLVPFSLARARSVNATKAIPTLEVSFRAHDSSDEVIYEFKHSCMASVPPLAPEPSFEEKLFKLLDTVEVDADETIDGASEVTSNKETHELSVGDVSEPSEDASEQQVTVPEERTENQQESVATSPEPIVTETVKPTNEEVETEEDRSHPEAVDQCLTAEDGLVFKLQVPVMRRSVNATSGIVDNRVLQVIDGQACFFNDFEKHKQKLCFALAIGAFQPNQVMVAWPRDEEVQKGNKELVISFVERNDACVDILLREMGFEGGYPTCFPDESLIDFELLAEQDAQAQELELEELGEKNRQEGRRLACEAKKRRLAEAAANVTALDRALDWMQLKLHPVVYALGFSTVEYVDDQLDDDNDNDDVCSAPLPETTAQAAQVKKPDALLSKDTFGDSLRHVNKLYNRVFGKAATRRRVPAHMPFLIQRKIFNELKSHWPMEFNATSSHRFRHPQDMQFSFSYFHYLLNRHKLHSPTLEDIWKEYLDANANGMLDESEILTVASIANGDYPTQTFINDVKQCLKPAPTEKTKEYVTLEGEMRVTESLTPFITLEQLQNCDWIVQKLLKHVRKEKNHVLMSEEEVTFHMLSDQYSYAFNQMLGTRARRTKFVCINDDMKYPSTAVSNILHELFLAIWPKTSQFELPFHLRNRYAHIDDYKAAKRRVRTVMIGILSVILMVLLALRKQIYGLFCGEEDPVLEMANHQQPPPAPTASTIAEPTLAPPVSVASETNNNRNSPKHAKRE